MTLTKRYLIVAPVVIKYFKYLLQFSRPWVAFFKHLYCQPHCWMIYALVCSLPSNEWLRGRSAWLHSCSRTNSTNDWCSYLTLLFRPSLMSSSFHPNCTVSWKCLPANHFYVVYLILRLFTMQPILSFSWCVFLIFSFLTITTETTVVLSTVT